MAAASFRYGLTITGAVLLVTGTLCFAWWSDGEVGSGSGARLLPPREAEAVPSSSSSSSSALLRSVSFFCCGIGGILLIFGLLWSVKANARVVSRRYQYHFPRDLQYFTAEPPEKWNCRWEHRPCQRRGGQRWRMGLSLKLLPALLSGELKGAAALLCALLLLPELMLINVTLLSPPCPRWLGCIQLSSPCRAITGPGTHRLSRATKQKDTLVFWQKVWMWGWGGVTQSSSPGLPGLQCSVRVRVFVTSLMEAKIFLMRELNEKK